MVVTADAEATWFCWPISISIIFQIFFTSQSSRRRTADMGEGKAMCISKARAIARRANTRRAKKASRDIFYLSYARLRMRVCLVIRTQANLRFCAEFLLRVRKLLHIRLRHCPRLSA